MCRAIWLLSQRDSPNGSRQIDLGICKLSVSIRLCGRVYSELSPIGGRGDMLSALLEVAR